MAENENNNSLNPTINVNTGAGLSQGEASLLAAVVELIRQSGIKNNEIKDLLSNLDNLPTTQSIEGLNDNLKESISKSVETAKNAIMKKLDELSSMSNGIVDNSAEITKLQESLDRIESMVENRLKESTSAEKSTARAVRSLVKTITSLEKRVEEMKANGQASVNPVAPENTTENPVTPTTPDNTENPPVNDNQPVENTEPAAPENTESQTTPENLTTSNTSETPSSPVGSTPETPTETATPTKSTKPTAPVSPVKKPKLKKLRFVQKSLQQTKILSEPKQPWYKRLATFAIKHPIISVVAGAGLGLGLFGATCGIAAIAGGTSFLTAVNMLIPSIPGFVGVGAVAGGAVSVASNTLPKGKWGLVAKANKQFGKVKKIDKTKQWVASFEKQHQEAKEIAREKHKASKGLVRKLKVHKKVAKVHKLLERTSKKVGRLYQKKLEKATTNAIDTKIKLNTKEIKSGKTQAVAGYLQKKRKAEAKFAAGKIDAEELDERITDLDDDVADLDGGEPGLREVGNQYTFDAEALEAIKAADAKGKNPTFQAVKNDILTRNSRPTRSIETRVVLDPEYLSSVIEEMKKKGETENLAAYENQLAEIRKQASEAENFAAAQGIENFEALEDMTDEEVAKWEEENNINM